MNDVPGPAAIVERRIVTVLFADLVGFTPLSERLDAEDVATIQDAYFARVRETVSRYGGALEKFIGDAAMAVFGVPRTRDDDAVRAVRAGLALISAVEQLGAGLGLELGELQLRVGVHSGEAVLAMTGPDAGRVTGDTVNTAARLQSSAAPGMVLIGEVTALAVADAIEVRPVGPIELKGKAAPVRASQVIRPRPEPSREAALGSLRAPMFGRTDELATLLAAARECASLRRSARITVVAAPGVGKSRLLAEFADAGAGEVAILRSKVRPQATAPYETVAQLFEGPGPGRLEEALVAAGLPLARAAVVADEVRTLTNPTTRTPTGGSDLPAEREARFEAWIEALDALVGQPAAWLVEDAHWAGPDLLAFLDRAGTGDTAHGRLVIVTARPSLLESSPGWSGADRLDLAPLRPTDGRALIEALVGPAMPDALVEAILERSDGTPLFIEEMIRTWIGVGTLVPSDDGGWRLALEPASVPFPPTVQAIYAAQLDDLPPDARLVARRGSVAGRRVPVAALAPLQVDTAAEGLDALRRRALIAGPTVDPITGEAYAYRHALLRDAGYASLARSERARLHLAMARWLTDVAGDRVGVVAEAVAEHYAAALEARPALATGLPDPGELAADAATWYERAADAALALNAHEAAARHFARAVGLTDADRAPIDRARRRLRHGEVLAASANLAAGIAELEAALREYGEDPRGAVAASALAHAYMQQMRFPEAERLTAETLERLGDRAPLSATARLHALHAWSVSAQGRSDGVVAEADAAEAMAAAADDPHAQLEVLEHAASARDEVDAASAEHWARLADRARLLGRWPQVVSAGRVSATYVAMEDPAAALPLLEEVGQLAIAHGLREQAGWADYSRCEALWVLDRCDEALAIGIDVIGTAERLAYDRLAFRTWVIVLAIAAVRGDRSIAERYRHWWAGAKAHAPAAPSPYAHVLREAISIWLARADGERPRPPDPSVIDAIVPMVNPHYLAALETVVEAWAEAGESALARAAAERSAEVLAEPDATALMRASAALQSAMAGDREAAERSGQLAAGVPAPWWERRANAVGIGDAQPDD